MPYKDLRFKKSGELSDILKTTDNNYIGKIVEAELHFPIELHDKSENFPACDTLTPQLEWLNNFHSKLLKKNSNR